MASKAVKIGLGILIFAVVIFVLTVLISRLVSHEELDDVHPLIMDVDDPILQRSAWIWVIPMYMGEAISKYPEWVRRLKNTGKTIGLHGVKHTVKEFGIDRSDEYIDIGINEFTKAFGYRPKYFKAPGLALTSGNAKKLKKRGIKIRGHIHQVLHRVHHHPNGRLSNGLLIGE